MMRFLHRVALGSELVWFGESKSWAKQVAKGLAGGFIKPCPDHERVLLLGFFTVFSHFRLVLSLFSFVSISEEKSGDNSG